MTAHNIPKTVNYFVFNGTVDCRMHMVNNGRGSKRLTARFKQC